MKLLKVTLSPVKSDCLTTKYDHRYTKTSKICYEHGPNINSIL